MMTFNDVIEFSRVNAPVNEHLKTTYDIVLSDFCLHFCIVFYV